MHAKQKRRRACRHASTEPLPTIGIFEKRSTCFYTSTLFRVVFLAYVFPKSPPRIVVCHESSNRSCAYKNDIHTHRNRNTTPTARRRDRFLDGQLWAKMSTNSSRKNNTYDNRRTAATGSPSGVCTHPCRLSAHHLGEEAVGCVVHLSLFP